MRLGVIAGVFALFAATTNTTTRLVEKDGEVTVGQPLPTFSGWDPGGGLVRLADALAPPRQPRSRAVVVSVFATWCVPCEAGLPVIQKVVAEDPDTRGVLIALPPKLENVSRFLDRLGVDLPVVVDSHGKVAARLGVTDSIPRTYVVDQSGVVRAIFVEEGGDFGAQLLAEVQSAKR